MTGQTPAVFAQMAGMSRSGRRVMNTAKNRSSAPSRRLTSAARVNAVGQNPERGRNRRRPALCLAAKVSEARSPSSGAAKGSRARCIGCAGDVDRVEARQRPSHILRSQPASATRNSTRWNDNARQRQRKNAYRHTTTTDQSAALSGAQSSNYKLAAASQLSDGLPGATPDQTPMAIAR